MVAWNQAPFGRYYINTVVLVIIILVGQLVLSTLAAYAFARFKFRGSGIAFALVLLQLMVMPDVLIVENYRMIGKLNLLDTIPAIALPYLASAFGIFLLRQTFKSVPQELVEAARVEGAGPNGEPLYAASWYREPYEDELRGYLSTASGPGWALIACRTVPNFRVEDCIAIDEWPERSNLARAVLAASWQFRVRPPIFRGQPQVGQWVRIRIDYGLRKK